LHKSLMLYTSVLHSDSLVHLPSLWPH